MKKTTQKPASFLTVYEIRNEACRRQHKNLLSCFNTPKHSCQHLNLSHPRADLSYVFNWELESNQAIKVNVYQEKLPVSLTQEACHALGLFMPFAYKDSFSFTIYCAKVFKHLLETQQGYWQNFSLPLTWSAPKTILFNWEMREDGAQHLDYAEQDIRFFVLDELIYLNHQTGECGIMETNVSHDYLKHYQEMVSYAPSMIDSLTNLCQKYHLPLPQKIKAIAKKTPKITPCLHLGGTMEEGEWGYPQPNYLLAMASIQLIVLT